MMVAIILITENKTEDGFTVSTEILLNPKTTDVEKATAEAGHTGLQNAMKIIKDNK